MRVQILEADSIKKGLALWQSEKPDVVLLDLCLPDGNGLNFLEAIREDYPGEQLPVIVITGHGDERDAVRAMKMGAADYQVKEDITRVSLPTSIRQAVERSVLGQQLVRSRQQASLVGEIALRIRQSLNLDEVLTAIVDEVRQFLQTDRVIVYQFNPDMSGLVVAESVAAPWTSCLNTEIVDTCFQENLGGEYCNGRIFIADDIYTAGLSQCHLELLEQFQVRANLVVPILLSYCSANVLWGLLIAHHCGESPRQWKEADTQLLSELAVQSAIAIQQAKLYQDLQNLNSTLERQVQERTSALAANERKFRAIFNNAIVLTAVLDLDGELLEINQTALTFKGLKLEQVIGLPFPETPWWDISRTVRDDLRDKIAQAAAGKSLRYEIEVLDARKEIVPLDFSLRPLRDEFGQILMVIAEGRDIRVTKQNEATLRFQAQILDQISDGVISTDARGIICSWNQGAEKLYGYKAEETLGQSVSIIFDEPADLETLLLNPLLEKGSHEVELRARSKTGHLIYVSLRLSTMLDERGEIAWLIGCANDITQRKQAEVALRNSEAALRRSEEFNRLAVEASRIGTWDLILPAKTCIISSGMASLMGYSSEQTKVSMEQWQGSIIPEDVPVFKAAIKRTIESNDPFNVEFRIKLPDKSIRWLYSRGGLSRNEFGQPVRIRGASIDISDRKELEAARQKAEVELQKLNQELEGIVEKRTAQLQRLSEKLSLALKSGAIGCWDWDIKSNNLIWDDRMYEMFGFENPVSPELLYDVWLNSIHPDDRGVVVTLREQVLPGYIDYDEVFRVLQPDGEIRFIQAYGMVIRDAKGNPLSMIGINFDISARKRAELALRQSEEFKQRLLESSSDCIIVLDRQGRLIYINEGGKQLMQIDKIENYLDKKWSAIYPPEGAAEVEEAIFLALRGQPNRFQNSCPTVKGIPKWWDIAVSPIFDEEGEVYQILFVSRDVTNNKRYEAQLHKTNEELARATRLKDEFLANMSHELRTPLNAILGLSEALQEDILGPLNERQRKSINTIEESGKHLLELINDILDLAKISSGKMELNLSAVPVENLCNSSLLMVRQQALQKGVNLDSDILLGLPSIIVDERQIRQVLINLLTNAIKFTAEGGQVNLRVGVRENGTWQGSVKPPDKLKNSSSPLILLQVADTGIGIKPEDQQKLFQPFVQIDSSLNRQQSGTGLGLALVKRIIELHEGEVIVESQAGQGSIFTVILPYKPSLLSRPSPKANTSNSTPPAVIDRSCQGPVILLAEDNEANIATFSNYLIAQNYTLVVARNGKDAVKMAKSREPDLIIMDVQMPEMNGLEAIKQIRSDSRFASIPIIVLSALVMPGDRERCLNNGANEFLSKPIRLKNLLEVIERTFKNMGGESRG